MMPAEAAQPPNEARIRAALWFAERGFAVFSVWSATGAGACRCPKGGQCDNPGKHPITPHGFLDATRDPERIRTMLSAASLPNYGLVAPDGVFILDVDGEGLAILAALEAALGPLPPTLRTATAHGQHIFLRWPADLPRPIGQLFGFVTRWGSGHDAGYVIGPRSVHASGAEYVPTGDCFDIAELPEAWARSVVAPGPTSGTITISGGYTLPERVAASESRYEAIRTYTAHLYNRRLSRDEMWPLVLSRLAPRFEQPLSEGEVRSRFDRCVADLAQRLGAPRAADEGPSGPLEDAPLTEFASQPIEWLWPAWLPRGVVTLMDGNPGVAKSTLVADLVARITMGWEWPDGAPPCGGSRRVMWITTEDDPGRVLRPRIEAAGGDASLVRFVKSEVVFPSGSAAFRELVVRRSQEPQGLALVILDPLFSHIEAKVRTIADAEMRKGVMNPLGEAAEAARVAILVVRHFNKDTTASALNRGAGSLGGIVGAARALWSVTLDPEDESGETKAVGVAKLNYARPMPPLRYRVVDRLPPGWVTGSVSGIEWMGPAPVSIAEMMTETPGMRGATEALEEILRDGPLAAESAIGKMHARGFGTTSARSAKRRLGVVSTKSGMSGGWEWSLRPGTFQGAEGDEDAEAITGDAFGVAFEDVEGDRPTSSATPSAEPRASRMRAREGRTPSASSSSSKVLKVSKMRGLHARARPREAGGDIAPVVEANRTEHVPCRDYANHQSAHYRSRDGWHCRLCEEAEA